MAYDHLSQALLGFPDVVLLPLGSRAPGFSAQTFEPAPSDTYYCIAEYWPPNSPDLRLLKNKNLMQWAYNAFTTTLGFSHVCLAVLQVQIGRDGRLDFVGEVHDLDIDWEAAQEGTIESREKAWAYRAGNRYMLLGTTNLTSLQISQKC